jgi:hypothetical protein
MRSRHRDLLAIGIALAGGVGYLIWHNHRDGHFMLKPDQLASTLGLQSTPGSMTVEDCREVVRDCATDYVTHACVGTIAPSDFGRLLEAGQAVPEQVSKTSHELVGTEVGVPYDVTTAYQVITSEEGSEYVSLPTESGYGDLYVYSNANMTRYATRKRILTAVECF